MIVRITAALVLALGLLVSSPSPRASAGIGDLTVTLVDEYGYVSTEFSTPVGYGEHSSVSGALVDAATKAAVPGFYPPRKGSKGSTSMQGALLAGNYTLTLTDTTLGHWSCSIYNSSGCSWIDEYSLTYVWKFHWSGSGTITVPRVVPQPEIKGKAKFNRLSRTACRVKGQVLSRVENADFSMGPWTRYKRTVKVQYRHAGFWYRQHKGKSKPSGKFDLQFKCTTPRVWRVWIPAERGLPEAYVVFKKKR